VLGSVRVGPHRRQAVPAVLRAAGPDLLPADQPAAVGSDPPGPDAGRV
jgi:hypothetical protein